MTESTFHVGQVVSELPPKHPGRPVGPTVKAALEAYDANKTSGDWVVVGVAPYNPQASQHLRSTFHARRPDAEVTQRKVGDKAVIYARQKHGSGR